jgi:hypothetical protein
MKNRVGMDWSIWFYLSNTIWNLPGSSKEGDLLEWGYGEGRSKTNEQGTVDKNRWTFSEFLMNLSG